MWRNRGLLAHAASETEPLTGLPPKKNKIRRGTGGTTQAANALVMRARATHAVPAIVRMENQCLPPAGAIRGTARANVSRLCGGRQRHTRCARLAHTLSTG